MKEIISELCRKITPSATLAVSAKAKQLIAEGKDVVLFGAGEPDLPTPKNVCEAAKKAIDENYSYYTDVAGSKELKQAVQKNSKETIICIMN
ncbi:MAG: aspartate aminotransferase [Candidatus Diapherotrites archaeon]